MKIRNPSFIHHFLQCFG